MHYRGYVENVEVRHLDTDGRWAAAAVSGTNASGEQLHFTLFISNGDYGWTAHGGAGGSSRVSSGWRLAPERGEPRHDGRKGIAAFSINVPQDVDQLRVSYRRRRLSPRQYMKTVPVIGGEAFVAVWDCHSTWGVTRVDARSGEQWTPLDSSRLPFRFEPVSQELASWWRSRRSGDGWFSYKPRGGPRV
jgi:hypothetical protein